MDETEDIFELISSPDNVKRDKGYLLLYKDEAVNKTVRGMLARTKLLDIEAEEVLHEGLLRVQREITANKFRREAAIQTYFFRICVNLIKSELRKRGRDKIDLWAEVPEDLRRLKDDESEISDEERNEELFEMLKKDLSKLSEDCQKVLRDRHMYGLSHAEIADEMGLANPGQGKKKFHRCMKYFNKILSQNPFYKK